MMMHNIPWSQSNKKQEAQKDCTMVRTDLGEQTTMELQPAGRQPSPRWLLDTALKARSRVDNLVLSVTPPVYVAAKTVESDTLVTQIGSPKEIGSKLREQGKVVYANRTNVPVSQPSSIKWSEVDDHIESKKVSFLAESATGVQVNIPEKLSPTQTEANRLAIARAIQLADKVMSNDVAFELAGIIMKHGVHIMTSAPDWCFNSASQAIANVYSKKALENLKIEVPQWNRKTIRVRVAIQRWGTYFGLGYQLIIRGRVKLMKKTETSDEFIGHYLCTCTSSSALGETTEGAGFIDSSSESLLMVNNFINNDGLNATSIEWEGEEDDENDEENWVDVEEVDEEEEGQEENSTVAQTYKSMLSKDMTTTPRLTASSKVDVLCWGDNEHGELSDKHTIIPSATLMTWQPLTPWEYVRHLATSSSHTVLATSAGTVYTCGDGSEGALGHGDLERCQTMRPVLWFAELTETPDIIAVSAGADLFGNHSMALDSKGRVYTWGIGSACGRGSRKPLPEPALVDELNQFEIHQIDCGGGYSMALSKCGDLYTWGNWNGGRLGLGPVPSKSDPSYLHGRGRKRLLPLLLYPKQVPLDGVKLHSVSCGDAHTVAITRERGLLVWGQNESGQCGVGPSPISGLFESVLKPQPLPRFSGGDQEHSVVFAACGASHTLVIDGQGEVWTWGALGGACLGHGSGDHLNGKPRHTFRPTSELQAARAVRQRSGTVTAEVPSWSIPKHCTALSGCQAQSASLGERHTTVLLKCGRVMMCGDGVALAHQLTAKEGQSTKQVMSLLDAVAPASVMRMPCASWFPSLEGKYISSVHCGGQHTILLSRGEHIGITLGWNLLQAARRSSSKRRALVDDKGKDEENDDDKDDRAWNELDVLSEGCDCVIITSGSVLPVHRVILAKRSKVLRELIAEEEIPGAGGVLELLLPELRHDTALALREYLYTDHVSYPLEPGYSLPMDLLTAAEAYELPRLKALCLLAIPEHISKVSLTRVSVPYSSLANEFGSALGDSNWSDVKFIADGKAIYAHIAILSEASEYFSKMFQFGKEDHEEDNDDASTTRNQPKEPLEVMVPDSYVGMLRMLLWIYTGYIDSSDEAIVLDDMLAADRFQLLELKRTCESLIDVSDENCVGVLEVAHMVHAKRLQQEALTCLSRNLHIKEVNEAAMELVGRTPALGELLFKFLADQSASRSRDKHHVATTARKEATEDEQLAQQHGVFPFMPLLLSLLFAFLYAYASRFVVLGPLVPIFNIAGLVGIIAWGLQTVRSS